MATKHVLDTHALIWYMEGNTKLSNSAKQIMDDPDSELVLPLIALAEAVFIVERGKTAIPDVMTLLDRIDGDKRIILYPLDRNVLNHTLSLPGIPEMHDRQIAATALVIADQGHTPFLITKDTLLRDVTSLKTIW